MAVLVVAPNSVRHPPAGDAGHFSLRSAKKTNEKKADPAGSRTIRLLHVGGFVVRHKVLAGVPYRLEGQRNSITQWFRGAAPDSGHPAHSAICRSRCNGPRIFGICRFRGFVSDGEYPANLHPAVPALAVTAYGRLRYVVGAVARSANTEGSDDGVVRGSRPIRERSRMGAEHGPPRPPRNPSMQSCAAPTPQERQGPNNHRACRQRQNHETSRTRRIVARCIANGRWPNGHGARH